MTSLPAVTVLMSALDAGDTIAAAIRSLQLQTRRDWQLLVVDDGSTDATADVVAGAAAADARITLVREPSTAGLPTRLNQLLAIARGRFAARLDADDIAFPRRLELQLAHLERHPEVDLLGTSMIVVDDRGEAVGIRPAPASHEAICRRPESGFPLFHPTWLGRLEWFRRFGYSADAVRAEDQELLLRSFASSRFANLTEPLVAYREDRLRWRRLARGRATYARAALAHALRDGRRGRAAAVVAEQGLKAAVDLIAIGTGTERTLLRHRARPLSAEHEASWRAVRDALADAARD